MEGSGEANAQLQLYHNPATAARELAIREPDNEEAQAERLAEVSCPKHARVLGEPHNGNIVIAYTLILRLP